MEFAHRWLFIAGLLLLASILAGKLSSRVGAPLLLVFLALGMIAGEEGLGGIVFGVRAGGSFAPTDLNSAYLIGSAALSLILLDGGVRTPRVSFRLALWPSLVLATIGVLVTAAVTGGVAALVLARSWGEGLLVGAIVASTDAAAVFLLLHQGGARLNERVNATLEVESGVNDPVAVFLTTAMVALVGGAAFSPLETLRELGLAVGVGGAVGLGGGWLLLTIINRLDLAAGLYPILAIAGALIIFAGAQLAEGSGFLAVYLAGIILGNARLRAGRLVSRFVDGMAWLAQIVLFLMLGLFVAPSALRADLLPALVIAAALIFLARPLAVWLCLSPFRFTNQERVFIAWVGLRGAVPIFLAMFPLLAGIPGAATYLNIAFVTVLASLILQGWTVTPAVKWLGLALPPDPDPRDRVDFDLSAGEGREIAVWRVGAGAPALDRDFADLALPRRTRIAAVLRQGALIARAELERLQPRDVVLAIVPLEQFEALDRLFSTRPSRSAETLGDLALDPAALVGEIADLYGLPAPVGERQRTLGALLEERLGRYPAVGDRMHYGLVDLVVRKLEERRVSEVGLVLEPVRQPLESFHIRRVARRVLSYLGRPARPLMRLLRRRRAERAGETGQSSQ